MAHCYSIGINIKGEEHEICTTHVPGNEKLREDIEKGIKRRPDPQEIQRAIDFFKKSGGQNIPNFRHKLLNE